MTTRFAYITDINEILVLEEQSFKIHLKNRPDLINVSRRLFDYNLIKNRIECDNGKIFLAEDENRKITGCCITEIMEYKDHHIYNDMKVLEIQDFCIDENYRRRKIGKKLFEEVIKYGKEQKVKFIELDVWEFNHEAKLFYEYLGMKNRAIKMELNIEN